MLHSPILIQNISLYFSSKTCVEDFSAKINFGDRIAVIGKNGSGKTTLLKMLQSLIEPTRGKVIIPSEVTFGYIPQVIENLDQLSGGQRFNKLLSQILSLHPNVLLLDEPTNHLDINVNSI